MPNPVNLSDVPDLTNKSIKRIHIKTMPHKSSYKNSTKGEGKIHKVLSEFKRGTLKSSSGAKVTSRKQSIAIALSEARKAGAKIPKKKGLPIIKGRYSS